MAYTRVNWEDLPSTDTPINATNLNKMDKGIKDNYDEIQTKATLSDIEDNLVNVSTEVDEDYRVNVLKSNNLFNKSTITTGYYVNAGNGTLVQNASNDVSDYIDISMFNSIVISGGLTGDTYALYNSSKVYVSGGNYTNGTAIDTSNASYIRLTVKPANLDTQQVEEGSTATSYVPYITPSIYVDNEMLVSKNVYSTGEVVIGEWLGKPLYRKVFYITSNLSSPLDIVHGISNIEYIKVEGQLTTSTTSTPPFYNNSTDFFRVFRNNIYLSARYGSGITATSITFIVEYTKTTD